MARKDTPRRNIIAKFAIGAEACADGVGVIMIADTGVGFEVFINAGLLPDGQAGRYFPGLESSAMDRAYEFAISLVGRLITEQVVPS